MELIRYVLALYVLIGFMVSGALMFNKSNKANIFLALFVLLFTLEQLDFLYVTSGLLVTHGQLYLILFPICLLFGPSFYFYIRYFNLKVEVDWKIFLIHCIPFFLFLTFTVYLFFMPFGERLQFATDTHSSIFMPLNYIKAFHVLVYGGMSFLFLRKNISDWNFDKSNYAKVLVFIYVSTAFMQACLTIFAKQYSTFAFYFFLSSSLVLFLAYILNYRPELLNQFQKKYNRSSLNEADCKRIAQKIKTFLQDHLHIVSRNLTLDQMCTKIGEKKHHVSQSISQEFKTSFNDLVNFHRIEYAKSLLKDPNKDHLKILAVAIESGFNNKNTFNRAFIKFTNLTPSAFRAQNR